MECGYETSTKKVVRIFLSIKVVRVAGIISKIACIKYHVPDLSFELLLKMKGSKCLVHIKYCITLSTPTIQAPCSSLTSVHPSLALHIPPVLRSVLHHPPVV